MTELCKLAEKYGVDKCPKILHYYTPEYHKLLNNINPKKFLEIGIGNYKLMSNIVGEDYKHGASLRMWKEYFKDCHIYGCDILEDVIFQDEQITTFQTDQSNPKSLLNMINNIGNVDIILDDGSHIIGHQMISFVTLWNYLNKGGLYIIEDIWQFLLNDFSEIYKLFDNCKIKYIYKHPQDNEGFIVFEKI
jgi:hypothetical protein